MVGWYTRSSSFIFDAFGRHHYRTSAFRSSSRIPQNLVNHENVIKQQSSPFVVGGKRFYSGDRRKIKHPIISALAMAGCVVVGGVEILQFLEKSRYSQETVPYTNRKHLLLFSVSQEKEMGERMLEVLKSDFTEVAPHDPLSIRAQKIGNDLVEVVKSRHAHLNEFEWEFVVVDKPGSIYGSDSFGGKIFVPSGLLNRFRGDSEVAAFIAREVAHAVARHNVECLSNYARKRHSLAIFRLILSPFYDSLEAKKLLMLPDRRRMELEADYIGLILMAYAGYDPRVAPRLYKEFGGNSADFLSQLPSGEMRAQLLLQPEVMDVTLSIYREVLAGRGIEAE